MLAVVANFWLFAVLHCVTYCVMYCAIVGAIQRYGLIGFLIRMVVHFVSCIFLLLCCVRIFPPKGMVVHTAPRVVVIM